MPELPEVETIRRGLFSCCLNKKIVQVKVYSEKSFIGPVETVIGASIRDVRRRGKALLIDLSNDVTVMIHLRMTGQLIWEPLASAGERFAGVEERFAGVEERFAGGHPSESFVEELPNKQTRVEIVTDGGTLFFNDQRKFGFIKPIPTEEVEEDKFIASLGPEPWDANIDDFYAILQRRKGSPIKAVILDQKVVAGIGNIYADEALFYAGVKPGRRAGEVTREEAGKIIEGAEKVMRKSIDSGGSTMATYVKTDGTRGDYLDLFAQVFRREGKECLRCGGEIIKTRVAGRGTHYCPECQK